MTSSADGERSGRPTSAARPPAGYFSIWQRLVRGYGPVAVLVVVMVLIAWLVPSRVPNTTAASVTAGHGLASGPSGDTSLSNIGGTASGTGTGTGAGTNAGAAAGGSSIAAAGSDASGQVASGGTPGHSVTVAGKVISCSGPQVPGDPYSPPCTQFSGSNGGATSPGVTGSCIYVNYRQTTDQSFQQTLAQLAGATLQDTNADTLRTIQALFTYFNTHYQFYGRQLCLKTFVGQGSLANELQGNGQAQAEADALTAKSEGVFADISAESEPYATDLASQKILAFGDPYLSTAFHQQYAPYLWSVATEGTYVAQMAAEYAVQKLCPAGSPATYAGGSVQGKPRKFALLAPENSWYQSSVEVAQQYMISHGCGNSSNITPYTYILDLGTESEQAKNLVAKLQSEGVTTILCGCDPIFPVYFSTDGAEAGYFPEMVEVGVALTDQDYVGQLYNQQFWSHAFGISPNEPTVPYTQTIGYAAYESVDPGSQPAFFVNQIYEQIAQLAIGIQMAGPDLTPTTFQQGMFNYTPRLGPFGLWGWNSSQYTVPNDVREVCWDPTATSPYNGQKGAYLTGSGGQRWTFGNIPSGPPGCPSGFPFTAGS
jgi:hypothetical protein